MELNNLDEPTRKTIEFQQNAVRLLQDDQFTIARSMLMQKSFSLLGLDQNKLVAPRCSYCGINFKNAPPSHVLKSSKRNKRFLRRLKNGKVINTKYQYIANKKFINGLRDKQKLITTCQICHKVYETKFTHAKHPKAIPNRQSTAILTQNNRKYPDHPHEIRSVQPSTLLSNRSKFKNKKSKRLRPFAGLIENAVLSARNFLKISRQNGPAPSTSIEVTPQFVGQTSQNMTTSLVDHIPSTSREAGQNPLPSTSRQTGQNPVPSTSKQEPPNDVIEIVDLVKRRRKKKRKVKVLAQARKLTKESKKQKVANCFLNLLNTAPENRNPNENLLKFLT